MSENVKAVSGIPNGSTPTAKNGYSFKGWFYDEDCQYPVPGDWVDTVTNKIVPKSGGVWLQNNNYYAKIEPDFTTLKISTVGFSDVDAGQIFMYRIKGTSELTLGIDLTVTVVGNGSVTINKLPIGDYTVTALDDWSYRYTPDVSRKNITLSVVATDNTLLFSHLRTSINWLDGNDNAINKYR